MGGGWVLKMKLKLLKLSNKLKLKLKLKFGNSIFIVDNKQAVGQLKS